MSLFFIFILKILFSAKKIIRSIGVRFMTVRFKHSLVSDLSSPGNPLHLIEVFASDAVRFSGISLYVSWGMQSI